jgi:hypothetical protein
MKKAIITFANSRGNYIHGLARLSESLRNNFDGDFLAFIGEASIGAEPHEDNPYNFKIHAIKKAYDAGYKQVLWLDCSCFAIKNVQPVFDHIGEHGYIMQDAGCYAGEYTNDRTLEYFNYTRDEAMKVKCYGNAGFLGLDFRRDLCVEFFNRWEESMRKGYFKGKWNNNDKTESQDERCKGHRHDLSCGSLIAHDFKMKLQPGNAWLQYAGPYQETANSTIIFKAQGL